MKKIAQRGQRQRKEARQKWKKVFWGGGGKRQDQSPWSCLLPGMDEGSHGRGLFSSEVIVSGIPPWKVHSPDLNLGSMTGNGGGKIYRLNRVAFVLGLD